MTLCFVYKVIRELESIDHLRTKYTSDLSIHISSSGVIQVNIFLTIVNKKNKITVTLGWQDSFHLSTLCVQAVKALVKLYLCPGLSESLLFMQ